MSRDPGLGRGGGQGQGVRGPQFEIDQRGGYGRTPREQNYRQDITENITSL